MTQNNEQDNPKLKLTSQTDAPVEMQDDAEAEERLAHAMLQRFYEPDRKANDARRIASVIAAIESEQQPYWRTQAFQARLRLFTKRGLSVAAILLIFAGVTFMMNDTQQAMALDEIIKHLNLGNRTFLIEVQQSGENMVSMDRKTMIDRMPPHAKRMLEHMPPDKREMMINRFMMAGKHLNPANRLDGATLYLSDDKYVISYATPDKPFQKRDRTQGENKTNFVRGFDGNTHWMIYPTHHHKICDKRGLKSRHGMGPKHLGDTFKKQGPNGQSRVEWQHPKNFERMSPEMKAQIREKMNRNPEMRERFQNRKRWRKRGFGELEGTDTSGQPFNREEMVREQMKSRMREHMKRKMAENGFKGKREEGEIAEQNGDYRIRQTEGLLSSGPFRSESMNDVSKLLLIDLREMLSQIQANYDVDKPITIESSGGKFLQYKATRKDTAAQLDISTFNQEKISSYNGKDVPVLQTKGSPKTILITVDPSNWQVQSITCQGLRIGRPEGPRGHRGAHGPNSPKGSKGSKGLKGIGPGRHPERDGRGEMPFTNQEYDMSFIKVENKPFPENWFTPEAHIPPEDSEKKKSGKHNNGIQTTEPGQISI